MGSIVLVEPDSAISEVWAAAIAASGHSVLTAIRMRDALAVVRDGGIDAVVLDAYDPCAGVVELAQRINALPDAPPIILVSDSPTAPWVSVRIGAATFVAKPCEPEELVAAIARLLWRVRPRVIEDEPKYRLPLLA
jgi:DNA-binding response OmpR family regulator